MWFAAGGGYFGKLRDCHQQKLTMPSGNRKGYGCLMLYVVVARAKEGPHRRRKNEIRSEAIENVRFMEKGGGATHC